MSTTKDADGTWRYVCGQPRGCGAEAPFTSSGWPTKALALSRGEQHEAEHEKGTPMPSLAEFRRANGVSI